MTDSLISRSFGSEYAEASQSCNSKYCPQKENCPLHKNDCESYCDILKTLEFYEIGLDEGRKPIENKAIIIAQTKGSFYGYHLIFYKKFKVLQNMLMYKGQVFVDKKCDGQQVDIPLPALTGDDLSKSICLKAFLKLGNEPHWIPLTVTENAKGNQYINYSIIYKDSSGTIISLPRNAEAELTYIYSIPCQYFGSYLNRTLSYFYENADISFFTDYSKISDFDFRLRIATLSNDGTKSFSTATDTTIETSDKKTAWDKICELLNSNPDSVVIKEIKNRCSRLALGKTFKLNAKTISTMKEQKSRNIELSWNSSLLFPDDIPTTGIFSSTITNK